MSQLKNIITTAAQMLDISADTGTPNANILFRCANLAVANIASNYIDCIGTQTFNVTNGKIEFTQFTHEILHIKSVKSGGRDVKYDLYVNFLAVPNGAITVDYTYVPKFTSPEDNIAIVAGIANEATILYGIMAEYAAVSGLLDDAKIYTARFEKLLAGAIRNGKSRVMK